MGKQKPPSSENPKAGVLLVTAAPYFLLIVTPWRWQARRKLMGFTPSASAACFAELYRLHAASTRSFVRTFRCMVLGTYVGSVT